MAGETGGAHRIELCANLLEGGTTPSAGLLQIVRHKVAMPIQVMIRPRGGDFCYSDDEFAVMQQDVMNAKSHGADGLVFGNPGLVAKQAIAVAACGAFAGALCMVTDITDPGFSPPSSTSGTRRAWE